MAKLVPLSRAGSRASLSLRVLRQMPIGYFYDVMTIGRRGWPFPSGAAIRPRRAGGRSAASR